MKLRVGKRPEKQIERMEAWWVANRPKAPTLFTDELEATFRVLCERPNAGIGWPTTRRPELRRILMPRTENHVYFIVNEETQTVHVVSVWGGPRGTAPRL